MAIINGLQVFRGLAALSVVAFHADVSTTAFVGSTPDGLHAILSHGYLGVDFFFVLSGFIIMHAHQDDAHAAPAARRYTLKRLARIFPPYWPVGIAMLVLYTLMPGVSASGGREFSVLSSLLLIPADKPPALSVAWTLVHELQFYLIFLLFFISLRLFLIGLATWAMLIVASTVFTQPHGWLIYPLSPINIEFMFGVAAALITGTHSPRIQPWGWVGAGLVLAALTLTLMAMYQSPWLRVLFALGLASIVMGVACLEHRTPIAWPAVFLLIGNASYSIYLVHNPLLSAIQRLAARLGLHWQAALLAGFLASILAGLAYYLTIERPALRFARNRLK